MTSEWSPTAGWPSYDAWKRWFRQRWGGLQASGKPPPGRWRGIYRVFSEPEGIQTEVEIVPGDQATTVGDEAEVRRRARASLVRFQDLIALDHHHSGPVVVVQVVVDPEAGGLGVGCGEWAAPPSAPRRPLGELVALALEEHGD